MPAGVHNYRDVLAVLSKPVLNVRVLHQALKVAFPIVRIIRVRIQELLSPLYPDKAGNEHSADG